MSRADEAFIKNNKTLRDKVASGNFPDVVLAQWYPHAPSHIGWMTEDGIHLTLKGALGVADYISRWVAHVEGLPCPQPVTPGGAVEPVCSNPDPQPPIADVMALYPASVGRLQPEVQGQQTEYHHDDHDRPEQPQDRPDHCVEQDENDDADEAVADDGGQDRAPATAFRRHTASMPAPTSRTTRDRPPR